jgi:hypothetical protein
VGRERKGVKRLRTGLRGRGFESVKGSNEVGSGRDLDGGVAGGSGFEIDAVLEPASSRGKTIVGGVLGSSSRILLPLLLEFPEPE